MKTPPHPRKPTLILWLLLPAATCLFGDPVPPVAGEDPRQPLIEAWDQVTRMDFLAASRRFRDLREEGGPLTRDATYGLAATLLNAPPRTPEQIDRAEALFREVMEANPNDETGIAAWFFLGRIAYRHRSPPDYATAVEVFDRLHEAHPGHRLGQFALIKRMIIRLYLSFDEPDPVKRFQMWDAVESQITDETMVRALCWTMGDAATNLVGEPERALHYYARGESLRYSRHDIRAMMLLRVQHFAREVGDTRKALEALRRFQREFPRSVHARLVEEMIADLETEPAP